MAALGEATETLADVRWLNAAPPEDPFFEAVAGGLLALLDEADLRVAGGLGTAARVCGRRWDAAASARTG